MCPCWCWITLVILLFVFVIGGTGTAIAIFLSRQRSSPSSPTLQTSASPSPNQAPSLAPTVRQLEQPCSYCFGGIPSTFTAAEKNRVSIQAFQDTFTCGTFQDALLSIPADDETCPARQAITWKHCGCPSIPDPIPQDVSCTLCAGGELPKTPSAQCRDESKYVSIFGSLMPNMCPTIINQAMSICPCPTAEEIRERGFRSVVDNIIVDLSVFDDPSSAHSRALRWLAVDDPLALDVTQTANRTIEERFVVVLLYFGTNGPGWSPRTLGFLTGTSVCDWHIQLRTIGVSCGDSGGTEVTSIVLPAVGMFGQIPNEIGALSALTKLDLSTNTLGGTIPSSMGSLLLLEEVDISDNSLSGAIPFALFNLPELSVLHVDDNRIRGSIPDSFSNATSLTSFFATENMLTGSIPEFVGQSTTLEGFLVETNQLVGSIPEFSSSASIFRFAVGDNRLAGTIPSSLVQHPGMIQISVFDNSLTGTIPPFRGRFASTEYLDVSGNNLIGNFASILSSLPPGRLSVLDVGENGITGQIPRTIGEYHQLTTLRIDRNLLNGTIPSEIGRLTTLDTTLNLGSNFLTGVLPSSIGELSLLQNLFVDRNSISGSIPTEMGGMTALEIFEAGSNLLNGTIPTEVANCVALRNFGVYGNVDITGPVGDVVNSLPSSLSVAYLGRLDLHGTLPPTVGKFSRIDILRFQDNRLTGTLPSHMGRLTRLTDFDVGKNQMNGTVPSELGSLTRLTRLEIDANQFSLALPRQLSMLRSLEALDVSANSFTGSLAFLEGLLSLTNLLVYGNSFSDVSVLCNGGRLWTRFAANICGSTPDHQCSCCTHCCRTGSQVCSTI